MPGNLTPAQMFNHTLDAIKGWGTDMHVVDKRGQLASDQALPTYQGMCVHLDPTTGKMKKGCPNGSMPMWIMNNEDDFDVNGDVGSIQSLILNALVAIGAYELQTTEFLHGQTYNPGTQLTSTLEADANAGLVKPTLVSGTDMIVGVVSDNSNNGSLNPSTALPFENEFNKLVINFWPVYCPHRG